ncbi:MAG: pyridoxal-phosphate dependent enzyme [Elusimicrobiales bacterium]|jgi:cysteine synthase|nr:pyridoxal-phosphate dependent enzyme [Elusimicrobiales bacterium]HOJ86114.1 pyridoxal-phosphate dependent enzyme [Elusimicrobiales bacterium]HOL63099.1 pyridoxal-phosphate dependent enzyme [Elusimicrobiales bacterium]HPO96114.1 pyridoxal-phosphate dependent enzyme [Elusimicrobiales bacterium]
MKTIVSKKNEIIKKTALRCREKNIIIPTFKQMKNPSLIPDKIKKELKKVGLWDVKPVNLFRINWHNDPKTGLYGNVNFLELPKEITGVKARIVALVGKYFPTGAHKVGAAFGCLVPRLVNGEFDPTAQKAVWPSTGNYCRGGAFDSALLGCTSIAILPEGMSKERFEWLKSVGSEIIATPGTESNVKEIYDKCWELRKTRNDIVIFNQFEEFGNSMWHYHITGSAMEEVFNKIKTKKSRLSAFSSSTGSAGTIAAGDYLKTLNPLLKITACEALQCPTLYSNGFGEHRIEGIGDKHVPWIHNVRNTDFIAAIDDEACMSIIRLFNEDEGKKYLSSMGIKEDFISKLDLIGISGVSNILGAVKTAKYLELNEDDVVFTVLTDSMELYGSRIKEMRETYGKYTKENAVRDYHRYLMGQSIDYIKELSYYDKKAIHNLKYFTWVEQQGKNSDELRRLWEPEFWQETYSQINKWDKDIEEFNSLVGLK